MNICVKDSFYLEVADGKLPRSLPYVQKELLESLAYH